MTQNGNPYENALAERINGIRKTGLNLNKIFANQGAAVLLVHDAIDAYNLIAHRS